VKKKMKKYAFRVDGLTLKGDDLTLYFEKESLHKGDGIVLKRSQVKSWRKDKKRIDNLFKKQGKSEKIRDRDIGNYEIKFKIGNEIGYRALEGVSDAFQAFSAEIII